MMQTNKLVGNEVTASTLTVVPMSG